MEQLQPMTFGPKDILGMMKQGLGEVVVHINQAQSLDRIQIDLVISELERMTLAARHLKRALEMFAAEQAKSATQN